ncbi:MAG: AAA family ATPase [Oscillatoria princeps RMCB-10]|jgi:predicted ATP-binding protein involved in virulence|nr:AAA family ATPase [Oscillatoria princeps RMCB-10]
MKVKRLKMTGFRGIGDLALEFDAGEPTVLLGVNGVGKSSILDCLAILLSWFMVRIVFDPETRKDLSESVRLYGKNFRSGFQQKDLADDRFFGEQDIKNGASQTRSEITLSLDSQELIWALTKTLEKGSAEPNSDMADLKRVTAGIRQERETNAGSNIPLAVYYPVSRGVGDISLQIPNKLITKVADAYDEALQGIAINFNSFFQWFRSCEDLENEERRDNPAFRDGKLEAVRNAISSLLPEFSNLRVRRSHLRMTVSKQGEELIVNQLSDGEKCLLAMVGDLARRLAIANPGLAEPLEGSGVVLIDEIELHLHPKWQREIIPALTRTFPNCQFIVTTHSPQVVSHVRPEGVYLLEKTPEGIVAKRPESSFGRDSNRILEDLMGVSERPQEIKEELLELFRLIDRGNLDGARQLRQQLANEIGADEPEFVRADILIRRKEILNK